MGLVTSFMGGGLPSTQMLNLATDKLYHKFVEKDISTFEEFHVAVLDIFNSFNSAIPGKHYDVPLRKEVDKCFTRWKEAGDSSVKKQVFIEFMKNNVSLSKLDDTVLITGLVAPPTAMVAKKAGENVPQLKLIKSIPDVAFVPSATVLALISVKLFGKIFLKNNQSP
ncbi:hypothetical protein Nepgr_024210 [Nepenthes gracilis]|uniref:Calcium ion-binding protein n=1 Tax=Nepenthes gracilis TaxID=150966 RepID=A0AAD3T5H6_NEPGR|nr:hypothetical protein Nepgr_024210 [Nepenthes gracilis]